MLEKKKGIIIKSVDYGESDKIITILNELKNQKQVYKPIRNYSYMAYLFIINGKVWVH